MATFYLHNSFSILIKLSVFVCALIGVISCFDLAGFMGGGTTLLYFTIQSNIWTGIYLLIEAILNLISIIKKRTIYYPFLNVIKLCVTVSITLTGVVFCFMLAPLEGINAFNMTNVLTHMVVPILTVVDYFIFYDYRYKLNRFQPLFSTILPLYYLGFSLIGYFNNWNFGGGNNYPYFFLNYDSPAGLFGFSDQMPYFMGSFYWIIILVLFVVGISYLYAFLVSLIKPNNKRLIK